MTQLTDYLKIPLWPTSGTGLDWAWIGPGLGWSERDFGVVGKLCHVEADFEALDALIFMAPAVLPSFFYVPRLPNPISMHL